MPTIFSLLYAPEMGGANEVRAREAGTFAMNLLLLILMRVLMQAVSHSRVRLSGVLNYINVKKLQFIHSVNGDGSKTAKIIKRQC